MSDRRVFANGCFDLFHLGHVMFLQWAAVMGDLTVAVNSDESVRRLKGPERPVVPQAERLEIVKAIRGVTHVVLLEDLTPFRLILRLQPDVLVVSCDGRMDSDEVYAVQEYGGRTIQSPRFDAPRTSEIITRVKEARTPCPWGRA